LWPADRELFGEPQIQADEEFQVYKNLYMKNCEIKKPIEKEKTETIEADDEEKINDSADEEEKNKDEGIEDDDDMLNEEFENDEDEENTRKYEELEENLDFEKFLFRYTHPHILKCFILMLGEYTKNSDCKYFKFLSKY
jgi:hypothetical protein